MFRSIKWRLQIWYGAILLLVLSGFGYTAFELQRVRETRRFDQSLQERMGSLMSTLRPAPPPGIRRREFRRERPPEFLSPLGEPVPPEFGEEPQLPSDWREPFYYVVWRRDGRRSASQEAPPDVDRPELRSRPGLRQREHYRELTGFSPRGDAIVVGRSSRELDAEMRRLALILGSSGAAILLVGLAGGWWVARSAMKPVEKISAAAIQIASGDLSHRISHDETESELGRLASVLNSTFARLDAAFNEQAQFTIDVSHELRTPVSVVLSQTQMTLARERSTGEYKETLEACQRAAQRMRRMIEALLQLARLDAGQEPLRRESFDLATVAADSVEMLRPLAQERGFNLVATLQEARCSGDSERVGQVIANLITNALQYGAPTKPTDPGTAPKPAEIRVQTELSDGLAICRVGDNGPGIPDEDLPKIFNRFYRVERSRSREKGGTGLGLAISKAIVNAHGGTIEVRSRPGDGTTFEVKLPTT